MAIRRQIMAAGRMCSIDEGRSALSFLKGQRGRLGEPGYSAIPPKSKTGKRIVPDPSIIAYPAFKAALLALRREFQRDYLFAYPVKILLC